MPTDPHQGYLPFSGIRATSVPVTGQALYDHVMSTIEPELTTRELAFLEEKYRTETSENARLRAERYKKAFALYDIESQRYVTSIHREIGAQRHEALRQAEKSIGEDEQQYLQSLDAQISSQHS